MLSHTHTQKDTVPLAMDTAWPLIHKHTVNCAKGVGMCVSLKHGLVIVSDSGSKQLHMYSLEKGLLVRSIGSAGSGKGQFRLSYGGMCVSPDGDSILVADCLNHRVQEVSIFDGSWVRYIGKDYVDGPEFVDCNTDVIAVSEHCHRISVLFWGDGRLRAGFNSNTYGTDPDLLFYPHGIRLLANGSGLVVADKSNHRLCVFTLNGKLVKTVGRRRRKSVFSFPCDVLECPADGSFIVANYYGSTLTKLSQDGLEAEVFGTKRDGINRFIWPTALATLPDGGLVVREDQGMYVQVFYGVQLRREWVAACVVISRQIGTMVGEEKIS